MSRQLRNSPRQDWGTPMEFWLPLHAVAGFKVDAAANYKNTLLPLWYGPDSSVGLTDALAVEKWESPAWCNPPYLSGANWERWLAKFKEQADLGVTVFSLLPAAVGTQWFRKWIVPNCDLLFITGRLNFVRPTKSKRKSQGNHDSVLAIWGPDARGAVAWINAKGPKVEVEGDANETGQLSGVPASGPLDGLHEASPLDVLGSVPGDVGGGGAGGE